MLAKVVLTNLDHLAFDDIRFQGGALGGYRRSVPLLLLDQVLHHGMAQRALGLEIPRPDPDPRPEPLRLASAQARQYWLVDCHRGELHGPLGSFMG